MRTSFGRTSLASSSFVVLALVAACGGSTTSSLTHGDGGTVTTTTTGEGGTIIVTTSSVSSGISTSSGQSTSTSGTTTTSAGVDADVPPGVDATTPPDDTGTGVTRNATCTPTTDETGTAIDTSHGRLDGTLVYVIDVGTGKNCNGDDSHVHLQIEVGSDIYDVAVDIGTAPSDEVGMFSQMIAIPDGMWSEGWHGSDSLGYSSLGLSSSSFVTMAPTAMASQVESLLANTSKISIFCKNYSSDNGCHDVHYEDGNGEDGAIVLDPTAATSQVLFFRFTDQTF